MYRSPPRHLRSHRPSRVSRWHGVTPLPVAVRVLLKITHARLRSFIPVVALPLTIVACSAPEGVSGARQAAAPNLAIAAASVTVVDLSGGITNGKAVTISQSGIILGQNGTSRGWWQQPSTTFTAIDVGSVQRGNRNADVGGNQGTVLLSTNGAAPWASVSLLSPAGIAPGATLARDVNNARVIVGNTLGTEVYPLRWDTPASAPTRLALPPLQYPASQAVASAINNNGIVVGYVLETLPKNRSRYEALVWSGSAVAILPLAPGSTSQLASDVNDAGVISGFSGSHPVRWTPNALGGYDVTIATLDAGPENLYTSIDACGRIVGGSASGIWVWDGIAAPVMIAGLGGPQLRAAAWDISESGTIVGSSDVPTSKNSPRAYRASMWVGLPVCAP